MLFSSSSFNNIFNTASKVDISDTNTLALAMDIGCFWLQDGNKMFDTFYENNNKVFSCVTMATCSNNNKTSNIFADSISILDSNSFKSFCSENQTRITMVMNTPHLPLLTTADWVINSFNNLRLVMIDAPGFSGLLMVNWDKLLKQQWYTMLKQ